jgi:hypothetical protein
MCVLDSPACTIASEQDRSSFGASPPERQMTRLVHTSPSQGSRPLPTNEQVSDGIFAPFPVGCLQHASISVSHSPQYLLQLADTFACPGPFDTA